MVRAGDFLVGAGDFLGLVDVLGVFDFFLADVLGVFFLADVLGVSFLADVLDVFFAGFLVLADTFFFAGEVLADVFFLAFFADTFFCARARAEPRFFALVSSLALFFKSSSLRCGNFARSPLSNSEGMLVVCFPLPAKKIFQSYPCNILIWS